MNAVAVGDCVFGLRNLQVLRGYRYDSVPESVRELACGPLGKWEDPGDGTVPLLEIVEHHGAPKAYALMDPEHRLPHLQAAGVSHQVRLGDRARRALKEPPPKKVVTQRPMAPEPPGKKELTIKDVAPNLGRMLSDPVVAKPSPLAEAGGASEMPESGPPAPGARPSLADGAQAPQIPDLTSAPELESPRTAADDEGQASESDEQANASSESLEGEAGGAQSCIGAKGDGERCSRPPRSGMQTCYSHRTQEPEA